MNHRLATVSICCVMTVAVASATGFAEEDGKSDSATAGIRVGTFDSRLVATAYVRSDLFQDRLAKWQADRETAKASGDEKRVKQIEANAAELQHLIHKQGFSTWPVHDILQTIKEQLPDIAKQAKVDLIISKWDVVFERPGIDLVDVTDFMVAPFNPDDETKKILDSLRQKPPVPLDQIMRQE